MTRSKFISIILAMFGGLAVQFQVSGASAQEQTVFFGIGVTYVTAPFTLNPGATIYSPNGNNYVTMQTDGNLVVYNSQQQAIWASAITWLNCGSGPNSCPGFTEANAPGAWFMFFSPFAQFEIYNWELQFEVYDNANEVTNGPGPYYLAIQDDGNLVVYDGGLNALWAASLSASTTQGEYYNQAAAEFAQGQCGCY
jgi:hypothetical protein